MVRAGRTETDHRREIPKYQGLFHGRRTWLWSVLYQRFFLDSYEDCEYFETIEEAAKYVSEIVGHEVEASVGAVSQALDDFVEEHEDEEPDIFYSFHEFTVLEP